MDYLASMHRMVPGEKEPQPEDHPAVMANILAAQGAGRAARLPGLPGMPGQMANLSSGLHHWGPPLFYHRRSCGWLAHVPHCEKLLQALLEAFIAPQA
jgi:hypothetical protein